MQELLPEERIKRADKALRLAFVDYKTRLADDRDDSVSELTSFQTYMDDKLRRERFLRTKSIENNMDNPAIRDTRVEELRLIELQEVILKRIKIVRTEVKNRNFTVEIGPLDPKDEEVVLAANGFRKIAGGREELTSARIRRQIESELSIPKVGAKISAEEAARMGIAVQLRQIGSEGVRWANKLLNERAGGASTIQRKSSPSDVKALIDTEGTTIRTTIKEVISKGPTELTVELVGQLRRLEVAEIFMRTGNDRSDDVRDAIDGFRPGTARKERSPSGMLEATYLRPKVTETAVPETEEAAQSRLPKAPPVPASHPEPQAQIHKVAAPPPPLEDQKNNLWELDWE